MTATDDTLYAPIRPAQKAQFKCQNELTQRFQQNPGAHADAQIIDRINVELLLEQMETCFQQLFVEKSIWVQCGE